MSKKPVKKRPLAGKPISEIIRRVRKDMPPPMRIQENKKRYRRTRERRRIGREVEQAKEA